MTDRGIPVSDFKALAEDMARVHSGGAFDFCLACGQPIPCRGSRGSRAATALDTAADLEAWADEAVLALQAATVIGERSCRAGDHLNYGNHDRLIGARTALARAIPEEEGS